MAAIPTWPILVRDDTGPNVRALQCLLNYRNNNTALSVDGSFGPLVYNAVATFQRQNNIYADGQAGATCFVKLVSTVKRGAINSAVRAAQHLLNKLGSSLAYTGMRAPSARSFSPTVPAESPTAPRADLEGRLCQPRRPAEPGISHRRRGWGCRWQSK